MVGQRLVELVPQKPAHTQLDRNQMREAPLGADVREEREEPYELEAQVDDRIEGRSSFAGSVSVVGEIVRKGETRYLIHMTRELTG
jgi:hypothetical protein